MHLFIRTAGIFAAVSTLSFSLPVPNAAAARKIPPTTLSVQYGKVLERGVQKIELTAVYENKGLYATQATISVSDTKTDELLFRFSPERDAGYSPAIALAGLYGRRNGGNILRGGQRRERRFRFLLPVFRHERRRADPVRL